MADYGDIKNCFFPLDLYYRVEENTWLRVNDDGTITVGMTDVAQSLAGSILHATPQKVGRTRKKGKPIAIVESSKWVGPVKSPVTGEIIESNDAVKKDPGLINKSPYKAGWIVKMKPENLNAELADMVTGQAAVDAYKNKIETENIDACVHCEGYEI
jgi:glycine cleavage system H protein